MVAHQRLLDVAAVGIRSRPLAAAAAKSIARAARMALVVFHRPAQLAAHPRAAADVGRPGLIRRVVVTVTIDPALAALAGSAIGGLTTLAVAWITQNTLANAAIGARER